MSKPSRPVGCSLPSRAGVGLKAEHYRTILETAPDVGFFEVHAENYMGAGGTPHRYLSAIRDRYPLSLHGVGLSIGADRPLDKDHLHRLRRLIERYEPMAFCELARVYARAPVGRRAGWRRGAAAAGGRAQRGVVL